MRFANSRWLVFLISCLLVSSFSQGLFTWRYQLTLALVLLPAFMIFLLKRQKGTIDKLAPLDFLTLGLAFLYVASPLWAVNTRNAIQEGVKYLLFLSTYWVVSRAVVGQRQREWFLKAIAGVSAAVAVGSVLLAAGVVPYTHAIYSDRLAGPFQYPNALAAFLFVGIGVTWGLRVAAHELKDRLLWGLMLGAQLMVFVFTYSRVAWLVLPGVAGLFWLANPGKRWSVVTSFSMAMAPVVALVLPFEAGMRGDASNPILLAWYLVGLVMVAGLEWLGHVAQSSRRVLLGLSAVAILAILAGGIVLFPKAGLLIDRLTTISFTDRNAVSRFVTYQDAVHGWIDKSPVLGLGGGGWRSISLMYRTGDFVSKLVHSSVVETLTEVGVQGVLLLLGTWLVGLWLAWSSRTAIADSSQKTVWVGAMAGLAGLMVHSSLDFDLTYPAIGLLMFSLIGVFRSTLPTVTETKEQRRGTPVVRYAAVALLGLATLAVIPLTGSAFAQSRAVSALQNQRLDDLRKGFETAVRLDPLNDGIHATYGDLLAQIGTQMGDKAAMEKAGRMLERAIDLDPNNANYYGMLTRYYSAINRPDKVFEALEKVAALDPQDIKNHKAALQAGLTLVQNQLMASKKVEARAQVQRVGGLLDRVETVRDGQPQGAGAEAYRWPAVDHELALYRAQYQAYLGQLSQAESTLKPIYESAGGDTQTEALLWSTAIRLATGQISEASQVEGVRKLDPAKANRVTTIRENLARIGGAQ